MNGLPPKMLEEPNLEQLKKQIEEYMEVLAGPKDVYRRLDNLEHDIYEEAIQAFYDKSVWGWIAERVT